MQQHRRRRSNQREALPDFARNLNASQRGLMTKMTKTGQRDMRTRKEREGNAPTRRAFA